MINCDRHVQSKLLAFCGIHMRSVSLRVLLEEISEATDVSLMSLEVGHLHTAAEQLHLWEALNLNSLSLVLCGIEFSDDQTLHGLNLGSQSFPISCHSLAVAAPRSIELNEDLVGGVENELLESIANDSLKWLV